MRRLAALLACLLLLGHQGAKADWDDRPGVDYDPASTATAPCGTSTPARGHFPPDLSLADHSDGITLTVRQDKDRLCYVSGDRAEAPTLRVRQGSTMVVTLRNEINDPKAIDDYVGYDLITTGKYPALANATMFSSDYPHSATIWPNSAKVAEAVTRNMTKEDRYKVLEGNAIRVFGFGR